MMVVYSEIEATQAGLLHSGPWDLSKGSLSCQFILLK